MSANVLTAGFRRALLVIILMLSSSTAIVVGQESSDTGEMSVSVMPSGEVDTDSGEGTGDAPLPGPASAEPPASAPASTDDPDGRPGTVSAWVIRSDTGLFAGDLSPTQLVVRDDRGTAAGWTVLLSSSSEPIEAWIPFLLENQPATIMRILPSGTSPIVIDEIRVGRTLGPMDGAMRILEALPGNGAGVYFQTLAIAYPDETDRDGHWLIYVHIVSGP